MSEQTVEKLFSAMQNSRGLPALESSVTSVLETLHDASKGNRDVVAHIVEDFALTQKVLKLVNSSMYSPFAKDVGSISSALNILGADALLHIVLSTTMLSAVELESDDTLSRTLLASELARNVCADRFEDVSIAALMYDLGKLVATKFLPDEMAAFNGKMSTGIDPAAAAQDVFGMSLQQLGAEVAKRWKLPSNVVSIIEGTGDPTLVEIARFSSSASSLIHEGKAEEVDALVAAFDVPGTDKSKLTELVSRKVEEIAPRIATVTPSAAPTQASVTVTAAPPEVVLDEVFSSLAGDGKKHSVEELARVVFHEFGETLKTTRSLLFMIVQSSGEFHIRYGYGKGADALKGKLKISEEFKPTAFHAVIKNNVDVSIADVSKLKASALPDGYRALLPDVKQFIILPIANGRVSGMIYFDWEIEKTLSQVELVAVKKLRDLFLPFFPYLQ